MVLNVKDGVPTEHSFLADQARPRLHRPALAPAPTARAPDPGSSSGAPRPLRRALTDSLCLRPRRAHDPTCPELLLRHPHGRQHPTTAPTPPRPPPTTGLQPRRHPQAPEPRQELTLFCSSCVWVAAECASILQHHGRAPKNRALV
jgi:hypothetical protein